MTYDLADCTCLGFERVRDVLVASQAPLIRIQLHHISAAAIKLNAIGVDRALVQWGSAG